MQSGVAQALSCRRAMGVVIGRVGTLFAERSKVCTCMQCFSWSPSSSAASYSKAPGKHRACWSPAPASQRASIHILPNSTTVVVQHSSNTDFAATIGVGAIGCSCSCHRTRHIWSKLSPCSSTSWVLLGVPPRRLTLQPASGPQTAPRCPGRSRSAGTGMSVL